MSSLINRTCRSYKQFKSLWLSSQHGNCFNCTPRNLTEREVLQQSCQHHFHFHHSKLVTDTHARASPEWYVRVRLHTWSAIYKNWRWESKLVLVFEMHMCIHCKECARKYARKFLGRSRSISRKWHLRLQCCQHGCPSGVVVITPD